MISDELRAANSAGAIATGLLALKIPVPLTTVQWADRHYYLPKESSYTPGLISFLLRASHCQDR
jgi:terminase, large subunit